MDLTYLSPIKFDFVPKIGSKITFEFKLKASKNRIKINIDVNILHTDPFIIGRVSLATSGIQNVYTSPEDSNYSLKFKIPNFKNRTQSYVYMSIDGNLYDKVIVEDLKILEDKVEEKVIEDKVVERETLSEARNTVYAHPNTVMAVPNTRPKISLQDIKDIVVKGYRDILKRDVDQSGLENYINQIKNGLSIESFHDILRSSQEYKDRFKDKDFSKQVYIRNIESFKDGQKIAIASIVRDEERNGNLHRFLDCCKELEQYHKNIVYIFVEGDSSDKTYDVLKDWVEQRNDGSILEKIDKGYSPFGKTKDTKRTIHLAELRNILIEIILSMPDIGEVLMIDANYGWFGDLITNLRSADAHIAAPLAVMQKDGEGRYIFYDIWVFRKNGREFWPNYPYTEDMQFDNPVDVDSVGSGYLVKRQVLEAGVRYDGNNDSEQVGFCKNARDQGFIIKINPKLYIRKGGYKE